MGNALKKMAVFGSLRGEGVNKREWCVTPFLVHHSSRVYKGTMFYLFLNRDLYIC
jgi:hypothetical protein